METKTTYSDKLQTCMALTNLLAVFVGPSDGGHPLILQRVVDGESLGSPLYLAGADMM